MGNLKRDRGYRHETSLVKTFNNIEDLKGMKWWEARRLGGSSEGLPDVIAVNNKDRILVTIEAKSRQGDYAEIENHQIIRCFVVCNFLRAYRQRYVIFAFKFMNKTRDKKTGMYVKRELKEYFQVIDVVKLKKDDSYNNIKKVLCKYSTGPKLLLFTEKEKVQSKIFENFKQMIKFVNTSIKLKE